MRMQFGMAAEVDFVEATQAFQDSNEATERSRHFSALMRLLGALLSGAVYVRTHDVFICAYLITPEPNYINLKVLRNVMSWPRSCLLSLFLPRCGRGQAVRGQARLSTNNIAAVNTYEIQKKQEMRLL